MGLPLKDIADKYPDVYFVSIIASDLTTKRNFIRLFPRQYQALYLEGLIAGALTETGNIGIVSAFPSVQVIRRQTGFTLGCRMRQSCLAKTSPCTSSTSVTGTCPRKSETSPTTLMSSVRCRCLDPADRFWISLWMSPRKRAFGSLGRTWTSSAFTAGRTRTPWLCRSTPAGKSSTSKVVKDWLAGETESRNSSVPGHGRHNDPG